MDQATNIETQLAEPVPQEPALVQGGSNVLRRHIKENPRKAALARHRLWLDSIPHEYPMPYTSYKIGVYIRYFNQTRHENYLEKHIQQYMDDIALCPQWTLVDFYVDKGMTAPHMEYSKEWCRLLEDCFTGKVDLIVTQKVSNVSSDWKEMSFMARMLAAQEHPVGIYFISEDTHNPFMISAVKDSNVYVLDYNESHKVYSTKLDYVNRAGTSNAILREVLGIDTSIPFCAEEQLESIIKKYLSLDFTQENLDNLRGEMKEIGLSDFIPDTIAQIAEGKIQ